MAVIWLLALVATGATYALLFDAYGQPGGDEAKCSGAQILRTRTALLVWGSATTTCTTGLG